MLLPFRASQSVIDQAILPYLQRCNLDPRGLASNAQTAPARSQMHQYYGTYLSPSSHLQSLPARRRRYASCADRRTDRLGIGKRHAPQPRCRRQPPCLQAGQKGHSARGNREPHARIFHAVMSPVSPARDREAGEPETTAPGARDVAEDAVKQVASTSRR